MILDPVSVTGGVDTHGDIHHAAVLDQLGREIADAPFPTTPAGYRDLLAWLRSHGDLDLVGMEGTGSYGSGLLQELRTAGVVVVEVDRPDRQARRSKGKSDAVDAYAAARAAQSGTATGIPKAHDGLVEAIRALRAARRSAVKARTQALNQLRALIVTAPVALREQLRGLSATALVDGCVRLRPGCVGIELATADDPVLVANKIALRRLARRCQHLNDEIRDHDVELAALVRTAAPQLLALPGVGIEVAGQLLVTAGDNPERLHSEAAFARLCGVAPMPASSGKTNRHRLNRGGDRAANNALYTIVLSRLRHDPATRAYAQRRTTQGLSKPEIFRCLKRYVARQIFTVLKGLDSP